MAPLRNLNKKINRGSTEPDHLISRVTLIIVSSIVKNKESGGKSFYFNDFPDPGSPVGIFQGGKNDPFFYWGVEKLLIPHIDAHMTGSGTGFKKHQITGL